MPEENKIFIGMKEIMNHYKIGSEEKFYALVKLKMPVKKVIGTWMGTQNAINKFFEEITSQNS